MSPTLLLGKNILSENKASRHFSDDLPLMAMTWLYVSTENQHWKGHLVINLGN